MEKTTVIINFLGLGLCYKKNNKWKLLLPFEDSEKKCHKSDFSYKEHGKEWIDLESQAEKKRKIDILHIGTDGQPKSTELGNLPVSLIDLTGPYAHNHGEGSEKGISLKSDWNDNAVEVTLNAGNFSIDGENNQNSFILVEEIGGGQIRVKHRVTGNDLAENLAAQIELVEGESLVIKINDGSDDISLPYVDEGFHEIVFNNDCYDDNLMDSEYQLFYEIIENKQNPNKKFELHWVPSNFEDSNDYEIGREQNFAELKQRIKDKRRNMEKNSEVKTEPCGKGNISEPDESFPG